MWNALGSMLEEADWEVGSSCKATVWRRLEDGTRRADAGALHQFLRFSRINIFLVAPQGPQRASAKVAREGQYETPVKVLLSGIHLAEKMTIISSVVALADWLFAGSLERLRLPRIPNNLRWVEGDIMCTIAKREEVWEWKELECMAGDLVPYERSMSRRSLDDFIDYRRHSMLRGREIAERRP